MKYGKLVRQITYDEPLNNVSPSIFPIFEEYRPKTHIFPNLEHLTWRVETPAGLDRSAIFLNPSLQGLAIQITGSGGRFPALDAFLADLASRVKLVTFSLVSPVTLPKSFTELMLPQTKLEKLVLVAPGALSPSVGRWTSSLEQLQSLQLDLSGRSITAVEGFFDELRPRSGDSTPSSVGSDRDSGVFSADEVDFSEIRKSALRLTGDLRSKSSFSKMKHMHLTGEAGNIAVFLKQFNSPLVQLDLVIEDPPDKTNWQDLSSITCERFGASLSSLKITATGASRFSDLVRSTSRAEPASSRLPLEHFTLLPALTRLDIDLPESVVFTASDIEHLADVCPNLEELKLCPLARFPTTLGPPKLSLDALAPLMSRCRRLQSLSVVVNAKRGSPEVLGSRASSSNTLLRLHVGHSWVNDPLQVTILLSHLAPYLETVKWFHEKNRPGYNESNARGWQKISDSLPLLQNVRLTERAYSSSSSEVVVEYVPVPVARPPMVDKSVDAVVITVNQEIQVQPPTMDSAVQVSPLLVNREIQAEPVLCSIAVDATRSTVDAEVDASIPVVVPPVMVSVAVDATATTTESVEVLPLQVPVSDSQDSTDPQSPHADHFVMPSIFALVSLAFKVFVSYPLSIPVRILQISSNLFSGGRREEGAGNASAPSSAAVAEADIPLTSLEVRQ